LSAAITRPGRPGRSASRNNGAAGSGTSGADPARTLMIGDNYELDVLAARAAGLPAVQLDRSASHSRPGGDRISTLHHVLPDTA
jgi:phosphoglycolate phosphatase-like HAD superfamily hydrolase